MDRVTVAALSLLPLLACTEAPPPSEWAPAPAPSAVSSVAPAEVASEPGVSREPLPSVVAPASRTSEPTPTVAGAPGPTPSVTPTAPAEPGRPRELAYPEPIDADAIARVSDAWQPAGRFDHGVALARLGEGLLARVGGVAHEYEGGTWVARPEVDAERPRALQRAGEIEGRWNGNAWRVSVTEHEGERETFDVLRFHRWRGNHRWVAQAIPEPFGSGGDRDYYDMGNSVVRPSVRGGLLLAAQSWDTDSELQIVRIAGGTAAPDNQPLLEDANVIDLLETKGATLFVVSETYADDRLVVQRSCRDDDSLACAMRHAVVLPKTDDRRWTTTESVARHRHGATIGLREGLGDDPPADYLLHHDKVGDELGKTAGYRLEATPGAGRVEQLVATPDGGLWAVTEHADGDAIWFRSDDGSWQGIDRPGALADADELRLASYEGQVWISDGGTAKALYRASADPNVRLATAGGARVMGAP